MTARLATACSLVRLLALCVALVLTGCGEPIRPPLSVGMNAWVGYDPLVLARDRQQIDQAQIKVVELATASETQRHLRNGLLDAAALTLDEVLRLRAGGLDLRIVAVLDASHGADVVMAMPNIHQVENLRGRAVAVEDTSVGALMLDRMLQSAGMSRSDVVVVHEEASLHQQLLRSGRVSAVVSYAPLSGILAKAGYRPLFSSDAMPGEILDVLAVRTDVLRQRPEAVQALLQAWQNGLALMELDPVGAAASLAPGTDLTSDDYLRVIAGLKFYSPAQSLAAMEGSPPELLESARRLADLIAKIGLVDEAPPLVDLFDVAPARAALGRGGP